MPILLKDYDWKQTDDEVIVRVKFNQRISSSADIFTHSKFIKVNSPPFLFEKFLKYPINEKESRCRVMEMEVVFYLKKMEIITWDILEIEVNKTNLIKVKEDIISEVHQFKENELKKKIETTETKKRAEIQREIDRESTIRTKIENLNKSECKYEMNCIEKWKESKCIPKNVFFKPLPPGTRPTTPRPKTQVSHINKTNVPTKKKELTSIPRVRKAGTIIVDFSKRNFTTPLRESQEEEEMEWLTKQHEARKAVGFIEEDLHPEERNPQWLKDKGDEFLLKKNYLGAISAYSTGIKIAKNYYELYLNRSEAHFALENYQRCIDDCTSAFELLKPACDSNLKARTHCLLRRGKSLDQMGYSRQGYEEIVCAVKLDPSNDYLRNEAEKLRCKLEKNE